MFILIFCSGTWKYDDNREQKHKCFLDKVKSQLQEFQVSFMSACIFLALVPIIKLKMFSGSHSGMFVRLVSA